MFSTFFLWIFCKKIVYCALDILRTINRGSLKRSTPCPNASEEVHFRLLFGSVLSLLLSLVELAFECIPPPLLVLAMKKIVIFDVMTGKPREILEQRYSIII